MCKIVEWYFLSVFCNNSYNMCHIATLMYGLGVGLGEKVLFRSMVSHSKRLLIDTTLN